MISPRIYWELGIWPNNKTVRSLIPLLASLCIKTVAPQLFSRQDAELFAILKNLKLNSSLLKNCQNELNQRRSLKVQILPEITWKSLPELGFFIAEDNRAALHEQVWPFRSHFPTFMFTSVSWVDFLFVQTQAVANYPTCVILIYLKHVSQSKRAKHLVSLNCIHFFQHSITLNSLSAPAFYNRRI